MYLLIPWSDSHKFNELSESERERERQVLLLQKIGASAFKIFLLLMNAVKHMTARVMMHACYGRNFPQSLVWAHCGK